MSVIFYFSYLFSVFFLGLMIIFFCFVYFSSMIYLKFLIVLVYLSGVVIFILYISCLCWFVSMNYLWSLLLLGGVVVYMYDFGYFVSFNVLGESLWMFLLFGLLFHSLVMVYCLNLFKVSGSLRF